MATNKISLVVKPTRSIPMVVKPVPKIGLMSMAPTKGDPGVGIESLEQTTKSTEPGGTNVWTATLTDGTVHDFEVMNGDPGEGIATGGTPGQVLVKASTTDYATRWMSILPEDTASGSVVSFPDGADDLPMGVVVDIDPVQDLHGYDNPWPGGGGKNLFDEEMELGGISSSNGSEYSSNNTLRAKNYIPVTAGEKYYFLCPVNVTRCFYDENKQWISTGYSGIAEITAPANAHYFRFSLASSYGTTYNHDIAVNYPSTATAYAPYSNICPISGRTGAKVTRTGKNLLPKFTGTTTKNGITFVADSKGLVGISGTSTSVAVISSETVEVKAGISYTLNGCPSDGSNSRYRLDIRSASAPTQLDQELQAYVDIGNGITFTPTTTHNICIGIRVASNFTVPSSVVFKPMIRPSSLNGATYEPYTAVTHEIPFSTEVYGGKLNVETGELVVDRKSLTIPLSTTNVLRNTTSVSETYRFAITTNLEDAKVPTTTSLLSGAIFDKGSEITADNTYVASKNGFAVRSHTTIIYYSENTKTDTVSQLIEKLGTIQICYPLATPITLNLSPVEIRSLFGDNNVFADTGNTSVTYLADVQKYIDKKISAAVAAMS